MNNKNFLAILICLLVSTNLFSQSMCNSIVNIENVKKIETLLNQQNKNYLGSKPIIRLSLHNVKKDNGSEGYTWNEINQVVNGLSEFYYPHSICFVVVNQTDINKTSYYNLEHTFNIDGARNDWRELISEDVNPNAINLYFIKGASFGGVASGFLFESTPNYPTATITAGFLNPDDNIYYSTFVSEILAHEIGHSLGLYHTHEYVLGIESIPRTGPNKNCETAGDLLCDTQASPNLKISSNQVDGDCYYIGGATYQGLDYEPDTWNAMSYTIPSCITGFSYGQGNRMRDFIINSNTFDNYVIPADYNLTGNILEDKFIGVEKTIVSSAQHTNVNTQYEAGTSIRLIKGFSTVQNQNYSFNAKVKPISCTNEFTGNDGIVTKPNNEAVVNEKMKKTEEQIQFSIFPNPTSNTITIKSLNHFDENVTIEVVEINGKVVSETNYLVKNYQDFNVPLVDFENLNQGVYFIKIFNSKFLNSYKVVKCENSFN